MTHHPAINKSVNLSQCLIKSLPGFALRFGVEDSTRHFHSGHACDATFKSVGKRALRATEETERLRRSVALPFLRLLSTSYRPLRPRQNLTPGGAPFGGGFLPTGRGGGGASGGSKMAGRTPMGPPDSDQVRAFAILWMAKFSGFTVVTLEAKPFSNKTPGPS